MSEPAIPAHVLPVAARAPGKCILFGEHSVVHGRPELLLAIDLYTQAAVRAGPSARLNGDATAAKRHAYLGRALELFPLTPPSPLEWSVVSRLPKGAGLGSSAAFSASVAAALLAVRGGATRAELAEASFRTERGAQGVGSPGDTSASVAGGLVALNGGAGEVLWKLGDAEHQWAVRRVRDPGWTWLVAYSGVPRNTAETVRSVGVRLSAKGGPALLDRFEEVALAGIEAVAREDRAEVGRRLQENQDLLREVGVSHPRLEALLDAVAPVVAGAKLTGAGAGGSIVALPTPGREIEALRRASKAGGLAFIVRAARRGAEVVEASEGPTKGEDAVFDGES